MAGEGDRSGYLRFWEGVGTSFPSLKGAASTRYYFECERALCEDLFPDLRGRTLLKSDLWDEAKNTEILVWAAGRGALPHGVDIAADTVREAGRALGAHRGRLLVADVRALPYRDTAFDLIYSMGTIEHFADTEVAVREMFRVLKPGGTAIVGVPNKLDPFLRPLLVGALHRLGRYAYGMEKCYTMGELERLLAGAGFRVVGRGGVLFMPGWLRMLDLWCHVRAPALSPLAGLAVEPFAWLYRRFPALRRHGYLIACAATRPD